MYEIVGTKKRIRQLEKLIEKRGDLKDKLSRLKQDPRRESGAHVLRGRFKGLWSCWLGSNIRMIYEIDDENMIIKIVLMGGHEIYG